MDLGSFCVRLVVASSQRWEKCWGEGPDTQTPEPRGACKHHWLPPQPQECRVQGAGCPGPRGEGWRAEWESRPAVPPSAGAAAALPFDARTGAGDRDGNSVDGVSIFLGSWAAASSCSTGLMCYVFATFNKLTCCIIIHVEIYLCMSQKSWVFHGIQGHTPGAAHGEHCHPHRLIGLHCMIWRDSSSDPVKAPTRNLHLSSLF
jgi:hypothetical protein